MKRYLHRQHEVMQFFSHSFSHLLEKFQQSYGQLTFIYSKGIHPPFPLSSSIYACKENEVKKGSLPERYRILEGIHNETNLVFSCNMYQRVFRLHCILVTEIVQWCVMFSKDLYNIHFKGVVIIDTSFERISFPQSQVFIQVVNVITALLLRSYFYACVKQLFSVIIFHISS